MYKAPLYIHIGSRILQQIVKVMMCEKYTKRYHAVYRLIIFNREKNYRPLKIFDPVHKTSCVVHLDSVMGMQYMQFQPIYEVIES